MTTSVPAHLKAAVQRDVKARVLPSPVHQRAVALAREMHELSLEVEDLEERAAKKKKRYEEVRSKELPDLFSDNGMKSLTLAAEGNYPELVCTAKPYYHANIASDWEDEAREAGFKWLSEHEGESLIKRTIIIELDRGDVAKAERIKKGLEKAGIAFQEKMFVAWASLTSWVKTEVEAGRPVELSTIGAVVGSVVEVKPKKNRTKVA